MAAFGWVCEGSLCGQGYWRCEFFSLNLISHPILCFLSSANGNGKSLGSVFPRKEMDLWKSVHAWAFGLRRDMLM